MYYITKMQSPRYHQLSLDELLFGTDIPECDIFNPNVSNTITYERESIPYKLIDGEYTGSLINNLKFFNDRWGQLRNVDRKDLYRTFFIPKHSGGLRRIDAPNEELMTALRELKLLFETKFEALYHTSAFAYIKNRSTIKCMQRHQKNKSRWYAKYDMTNFFGSTTKEFVMQQFGMIYPFCLVLDDEFGKRQFEDAIDLAFLNGGLPQGTPISPIITNIMMIPLDFKLSKSLRDFNFGKDRHESLVYTRYADDIQISCQYDFDFKAVEKLIQSVLDEFNAPFKMNNTKTRYGSTSGSNWNLGVMINADNNMTVGWKNKKRFEAMLSSYARDKANGIMWPKEDVQAMDGLRNYYRMVEKDNIDGIISHISGKTGVDITREIKLDLKCKRDA